MYKSLAFIKRSFHFDVSSEVRNARSPVIALESTIISHGMPYPRNLEVAKELEDIVRTKDCVPATIAAP